MAKRNSNRLRIIGGQWRSRFLPFPDAQGLRPTTDRIRETLFNWIQHDVFGARCLDLFAGSGALGFEALSREAGTVVFTEKLGKAASQLRENALTLNAKNAEVYQAEALYWLAQAEGSFDIVFLDPPFGKGLLNDCLTILDDRHLIKNDGLIYIESELDVGNLIIPKTWRLHKEKKAGMVMCRLYRNEGN